MQNRILHYDFIYKQCTIQRNKGNKFIIDNKATQGDPLQAVANSLTKLQGVQKMYHGKVVHGVINAITNGVEGFFITNSDAAGTLLKRSSRTATSYSGMIKEAIEKDIMNNKWLNNIMNNKNVRENVKISGIISQMIINENPHPHDDDSKRIDEIYFTG